MENKDRDFWKDTEKWVFLIEAQMEEKNWKKKLESFSLRERQRN